MDHIWRMGLKTTGLAALGLLISLVAGCPTAGPPAEQEITDTTDTGNDGTDSSAHEDACWFMSPQDLSDFIVLFGLEREAGVTYLEQLDRNLDTCAEENADCLYCLFTIATFVDLVFNVSPPTTVEPPLLPPLLPPPPETPTFVVGNLFSFMTQSETDYFVILMTTVVAEIDEFIDRQLSLALADISDRGLGATSLVAGTECLYARDRARMKRDATWASIDEVRETFGAFFAEPSEVIAYNCANFPYPDCFASEDLMCIQ